MRTLIIACTLPSASGGEVTSAAPREDAALALVDAWLACRAPFD